MFCCVQDYGKNSKEWINRIHENNNFLYTNMDSEVADCVWPNLFEVTEKWTEETNNRNSVDVIYLDFEKAFDTVPHQCLLKQLAA